MCSWWHSALSAAICLAKPEGSKLYTKAGSRAWVLTECAKSVARIAGHKSLCSATMFLMLASGLAGWHIVLCYALLPHQTPLLQVLHKHDRQCEPVDECAVTL